MKKQLQKLGSLGLSRLLKVAALGAVMLLVSQTDATAQSMNAPATTSQTAGATFYHYKTAYANLENSFAAVKQAAYGTTASDGNQEEVAQAKLYMAIMRDLKSGVEPQTALTTNFDRYKVALGSAQDAVFDNLLGLMTQGN